MRTEGGVKALGGKDLVSDAGQMFIGSAELVDVVECCNALQEPLESSDLGESSTFRELLALEMTLSARGESLRGQTVCWVCDSQSAITILKVGSIRV